MPGVFQPVDYLIVGHLTSDSPHDPRQLGGTAAYAGLTAARLGHRVGIVSACSIDLDLSPLQEVELALQSCADSTTFENRQTADGRQQRLLRRAHVLDQSHIPPVWLQAPLVHLAPVADEVDRRLTVAFTSAFLALTPQGLAERCAILAVTDGPRGCEIFWSGQRERVPAPTRASLDPTGAGDIFAAAFFIALQRGDEPIKAAQLAIRLASDSVTRPGISGVPSARQLPTRGAPAI
jgi:sugar/nucleoside kinase (ribokinase family)